MEHKKRDKADFTIHTQNGKYKNNILVNGDQQIAKYSKLPTSEQRINNI